MRHSAILFVGILSVSPLQAQDQGGPFGLKIGLSKSDLVRLAGPLKEAQPGIYTAQRTPRPHPDFESYTLVATPEHGLCKMWATGETVDMNSFGGGLKERFETTLDALESKYGKNGHRIDRVEAGSIWDGPQDWAMGLLKKERTLKVIWGKDDIGPVERVASHLEAIAVEANALSTNRGWVTVIYEFENVTPCLVAIKKMKNVAF